MLGFFAFIPVFIMPVQYRLLTQSRSRQITTENILLPSLKSSLDSLENTVSRTESSEENMEKI